MWCDEQRALWYNVKKAVNLYLMNHTEETMLNYIWEEQKIDDHFFNRVWWTKNIDVEAKNL